MTFDIHDDIKRLTRTQCIASDLPDPYPNAAMAQAPNLEPEESGVREPAPSAASDNAPVQRGSPLWRRLSEEKWCGPCTECLNYTEQWDESNGDWCCADCRAEIVAGQERDKRLDDPRHGQAKWTAHRHRRRVDAGRAGQD